MSENCNLLLDYFNHQLTKEEEIEFEAHLSSCSECQEELKELSALTEDLPFSSEPVDPPADMKTRVLGNIINETSEASEQESDTKQGTVPKQASVHQLHTPSPKQKRPYLPMMAAVLTLSLIGNIVALTYLTGDTDETVPSEVSEDSLDTMRELISLSPSEGVSAEATAMMIAQNDNTNLVVQTEDLPSLKGDETYQVWVLKDGEPSRAGTFILNENGVGAASYVLENDTNQDWDTIAITKEPNANSQTPKGDILLSSPI